MYRPTRMQLLHVAYILTSQKLSAPKRAVKPESTAALYLEIFLVSGMIGTIQIKLQSTYPQSLANSILPSKYRLLQPHVSFMVWPSSFLSPKDRAEPNPKCNIGVQDLNTGNMYLTCLSGLAPLQSSTHCPIVIRPVASEQGRIQNITKISRRSTRWCFVGRSIITDVAVTESGLLNERKILCSEKSLCHPRMANNILGFLF